MTHYSAPYKLSQDYVGLLTMVPALDTSLFHSPMTPCYWNVIVDTQAVYNCTNVMLQLLFCLKLCLLFLGLL